jgi:hypothetical protein
MIRTSGTLESLHLLLTIKLQTETNHAYYTTDFKQKLFYSKRGKYAQECLVVPVRPFFVTFHLFMFYLTTLSYL